MLSAFRTGAAGNCAICGQRIYATYIIDAWDNVFCAVHKSQYPECSTCGRLVSTLTVGGTQLDDGRVQCNLCRAGAVMSRRDLSPVHAYVNRFLRDGLGIDVSADVPLDAIKLLGRPKLAGLSGIWNARGFVRYRVSASSWLGQASASDFKVYLLYGLPTMACAAALAHELFHVFSARSGLGLSYESEEGVANLVSYILLRSQTKNREAQFCARLLMQSPDPVYGGEFRRALCRYKQAGGFATFLAQEKPRRTFADSILRERGGRTHS